MGHLRLACNAHVFIPCSHKVAEMIFVITHMLDDNILVVFNGILK
jgi:hypothetical protein